MAIEFDWDPAKAALNLVKHRISFAEASTVFQDALSVTVADPRHSQNEERFATRLEREVYEEESV